MKLTKLPKIEKGIPIPKQQKQKTGITDFLRKLRPGDSFKITAKSTSSVSCHAGRIGIKIVTRKVSDGVYRVWRVK